MAEDLTARAPENRILASIPPHELSRLLGRAAVVRLDFRAVLFRRGDRIQHVYFPLTGLYSLLAPAAKSDSVEVGTIGREGIVGIDVHLGADTAYCTAIAQVPGEAVRIDADVFREEVQRCETTTTVAGRYIHALYVQTVQWVACNRLHSLEERFSRWLLASADTLGSEALPLTHDFLAKMLGVRRPSVTLAAGALQRAGLIDSSRGMIRIVNREGLEGISCDCYRLVRAHYDRLLGPLRTDERWSESASEGVGEPG
ncbi:MAG TPA: Crp/Fnr family transcriptional regulator [Vicinamibacterales bacterium]|nr:Crp/Fnr family transcriptional regulator [Vicinamibacterales bacterium]